MRIFVLEDDFSQQARIETTIEKLLKSIITSKYSSSTYKLKPLSNHNSHDRCRPHQKSSDFDY